MLVVEESRDYGISPGEIKQFRQNTRLKEVIIVLFVFKQNFWPESACSEISGKWDL